VSVKGWEVVFRGERLQADILAAVLDANSIRVEVFGDTAYSYAVNFTEARVLVPSEQASIARRLIEEAQAAPSDAPEV
jgi:Putative prokaryotic signal transducing protein